jgi:hypothetical protein
MQQPSLTLNYLCTTPYCYSTCGVEHSIASVVLLSPMQFTACTVCTHPHLFHFHLRSEWVQVQEGQVSVDSNMKRQWEAAKNETEKAAALAEASQRALDDLSRITDDAMDDLAQLADEYARLSLSGSFSAPLEQAICLLEQQCKGMEEKGVGPEPLAKVRSRLEEMKVRLGLLRKAQEKTVVTKGKAEVLKGVREVTVPVQEGVWKVKESRGGMMEGHGGNRGGTG